jgi:hypothetical protein
LIIFILTLILIYLVDTVLVGLAFYSLRQRFNWQISPKLCFVVLIFIFAILDNYFVPMIYILDASITIRNEEIAKVFNITPNYPVMSLFDPGLFDFVIWSVQSFVAGIIGEIFMRKDLT